MSNNLLLESGDAILLESGDNLLLEGGEDLLADIRSGIEARLATIAGVQTSDNRPATPEPPCLFPGGIQNVNYHSAMGNGLVEWTFTVWALVSSSLPTEESQADLDLYIDSTGASSVRAAIEADGTLGGVVDDCVVDSSNGEAIYVTDQGSFYGAEFTVRVLAGA